MQLLLLKSVPNLGNPGELVDVKNGYGRNYLVPAGFAIIATPKNLGAFSHQQQLAETKRVKFLDDMQVLVKEVAKARIVFGEKVGPQGKLYGAVTNRMIAEQLSEQVGAEIDRRKIRLEDPIREPGEREVEVRLDREVITTIKVLVEGQYEETSAAETTVEDEGEKQEVSLEAGGTDADAVSVADSAADEAVDDVEQTPTEDSES